MSDVAPFSALVWGMCACTARAVSVISENDSIEVDTIEVIDTLSVDTLAIDPIAE
jgi:hypothetical protein